jgi:hypothetical protein
VNNGVGIDDVCAKLAEHFSNGGFAAGDSAGESDANHC